MPESLVHAEWSAAEKRARERFFEYGRSEEVLEHPDKPGREIGPRGILLLYVDGEIARLFDTSDEATRIRSTELYHRWGGWDGRPGAQAALSAQENGKG